MSDPLSYYLHKIERLRVDRTHDLPAPHKPLLLLAVLDLIERDEIGDNRIEVSPLLVETYLNYWKHIPTGQPRLRTSGFWHLHARAGQEAALAATRGFQSMSHLTKLVACASLDPELFMLLQRPAANENQLINEAARKLRQEVLNRDTENEAVSPARSAAFRQEIMRIYDYTCAACRLRIIMPDFKSAVDAAHIIRFADSHDDVINNGMALCKLHHWALDEHLIAVSDSYTLLVSSGFDERGRGDLLLRNLKGEKILLPSQRPFYPSLINLRQHRAAFNA